MYCNKGMVQIIFHVSIFGLLSRQVATALGDRYIYKGTYLYKCEGKNPCQIVEPRR